MSNTSSQQEFAQLLEQTYTNISNQERKKAEATLMEKALLTPDSFEQFLGIALQNQGKPLSEFAATFLNVLIKKRVNGEPSFEAQEQFHVMTQILNALQMQITPRLKTLISTLVGTMLTSTSGSMTGDYLQSIMKQKMIQLLQQSDLKSTEIAIIIWNALVQSLDIYRMGASLKALDLTWITDYIEKGRKILHSVADTLRGDHSPQMLQQPNFISTLQLVRSWASGAADLLRKIGKFKGVSKEQSLAFQNLLILNNEFALSLFTILVITLNFGQQVQETIISTTGESDIDNLLNETKHYVLQSYNTILQIIFNERTKSDSRKTPVFQQLVANLLSNMIISLVTYASSPRIDLLQDIRRPFVSPLITSLIQFIVNCGGQSEFYQFFSDSKTQVLVDVIFPLLSTSNDEYMLMINEPQEFVTLALDTIDKQSSDIPKTAAAQLLEMYCDHIDGSTTFISQMCVIVISNEVKGLLGKEQTDTLQNQFIEKVKQRYFFTKLTSILRIDACLVALTVMSYLLSRRQDIITLLEIMLQENSQYFKDPNLDPLIRTRLALFLGYFCDNIFKSPQQQPNLIDYINVLVQQLQPVQHTWRQAVMYQSVDALKNMFEDEDLIPLLKPLIPQYFGVFTQSLIDSSYEQHFEMIASMFKNYSTEIGANKELFSQAINFVIQKILKDLQLHVQQQDKDSLQNVQKCVHIISSIPEADYNYELLLIFEQELLPLYQRLEQGGALFEEDIVYLVGSLIEKTGMITEHQQKLFLLFPHILQRQKHRLGALYEILNLYITKGTTMFHDVQVQKILFEMLFTTINSTEQSINESDQGEGVLLVQLAIQVLHQNLNVEVLRNVLQSTYKRSLQGAQFAFMKSRLMGIFLSAFYADYERTSAILMENGLLDSILNELTNQVKVYRSGYDVKLFVITISKIIERKPELFNPLLIKNIIGLLQKQQQQEEKELKKKDIDSSLDDDDLDYEDDEEDIQLEGGDEEREAVIAFEHFKSEIVNMDEYAYFRNIVWAMKQSYPQSIENLKQHLLPQELQDLQQMVACIRVTSTDGSMVARKIVQTSRRKKQNI